jgi:hypothetical protein
MAEVIASQGAVQTPEVKPVVEQKVEVKPVESQPDILKRATAIQKPEVKQPEGDFKFDYSAIEKIKDPEAKQWALDAYKSMLRGVDKPLQEAAKTRREYEAKLQEISKWTPERVRQIQNDPDFVKAAQEVLGVSDESAPESTLSENDKEEIRKIKESQELLLRQTWEAKKSAVDAQLASKYSNYNPHMIDIVEADVLSGKRQPNREDIFKVLTYEDTVRNAYEMGLKDGQNKLSEKAGSSSFGGSGNIQADSQTVVDPKESTQTAWQRSKDKALSMLLGKK